MTSTPPDQFKSARRAVHAMECHRSVIAPTEHPANRQIGKPANRQYGKPANRPQPHAAPPFFRFSAFPFCRPFKAGGGR